MHHPHFKGSRAPRGERLPTGQNRLENLQSSQKVLVHSAGEGGSTGHHSSRTADSMCKGSEAGDCRTFKGLTGHHCGQRTSDKGRGLTCRPAPAVEGWILDPQQWKDSGADRRGQQGGEGKEKTKCTFQVSGWNGWVDGGPHAERRSCGGDWLSLPMCHLGLGRGEATSSTSDM